METLLIVSTTFERREDAEEMAARLVQQRLVACAQILGPVTSTYWWRDAIVSAEEYQLVVKSDEALYAVLEEAILAGHPYETPEIVATPVVHASAGYQQWLRQELRL